MIDTTKIRQLLLDNEDNITAENYGKLEQLISKIEQPTSQFEPAITTFYFNNAAGQSIAVDIRIQEFEILFKMKLPQAIFHELLYLEIKATNLSVYSQYPDPDNGICRYRNLLSIIEDLNIDLQSRILLELAKIYYFTILPKSEGAVFSKEEQSKLYFAYTCFCIIDKLGVIKELHEIDQKIKAAIIISLQDNKSVFSEAQFVDAYNKSIMQNIREHGFTTKHIGVASGDSIYKSSGIAVNIFPKCHSQDSPADLEKWFEKECHCLGFAGRKLFLDTIVNDFLLKDSNFGCMYLSMERNYYMHEVRTKEQLMQILQKRLENHVMFILRCPDMDNLEQYQHIADCEYRYMGDKIPIELIEAIIVPPQLLSIAKEVFHGVAEIIGLSEDHVKIKIYLHKIITDKFNNVTTEEMEKIEEWQIKEALQELEANPDYKNMTEEEKKEEFEEIKKDKQRYAKFDFFNYEKAFETCNEVWPKLDEDGFMTHVTRFMPHGEFACQCSL